MNYVRFSENSLFASFGYYFTPIVYVQECKTLGTNALSSIACPILLLQVAHAGPSTACII